MPVTRVRRALALLTVTLLGTAGGATGAVTVGADGEALPAPLTVAPRILVIDSALTERGRHGAHDRAVSAVAELRAAGARPDVAGDAVLARPATLARYDVVVLPYVACMDLAARRTLAAWVRGGGGLVGLYFTGRDDATCTPLVGQGADRDYLGRSHYGGNTEWADLSPALDAWFLNDVRQTSARFDVAAGSAVGDLAVRYAGRPLAPIAMTRPSGLWTELVQLGRAPAREVLTYPLTAAARPVLVYRSATGAADPRARRGAVVGWTTTYGLGRSLYLGVDLNDLWNPWARRFASPATRYTGRALLRAAVHWTAGPGAAPVTPDGVLGAD